MAMTIKPDYINLEYMPSQKKQYTESIDNPVAGLNLRELSFEMSSKESPNILNLFWKDGSLRSRDGQSFVTKKGSQGDGITCYNKLFNGYMFLHTTKGIWAISPSNPTDFFRLYKDTTHTSRGTFFKYQDSLFYKTTGLYVKIDVPSGQAPWLSTSVTYTVPSPAPTTFVIDVPNISTHPTAPAPVVKVDGTTVAAGNKYSVNPLAETVTLRTTGTDPCPTPTSSVEITYYKENRATVSDIVGYVPVILLNADPATGAGDLYQQENRISDSKTVKYTVPSTAPTVYYLPIHPVTAVSSVVVDGTTKTAGTDYTVDLEAGTVTFTTAPPYVQTATNTVEITYAKENYAAKKAIMDCTYATVYGGTTGTCIVMAGSTAQPNAYFWNANTNVNMDPSYMPIYNYQLAGATSEAVTGFGVQQGYLIIFKENSVGKSSMGTQTIDELNYIDFPYENVNNETGCDLPWTIRLVQNNLVWCTTNGGVHRLSGTTSAYENNVHRISLNINGSKIRPGLIADLEHSGTKVVSCNDGDRYWVVTADRTYVWDYSLSEYSDPAWFRFDNIAAVSFCHNGTDLYELCGNGAVAEFTPSYADFIEKFTESFRYESGDTYTLRQDNTADNPLQKIEMTINGEFQTENSDYTVDLTTGIVTFKSTPAFNDEVAFKLYYGVPIRKLFVSATQILGGYEYLKDITRIIFVLRSDTPSSAKISYRTNNADSIEAVPLEVDGWSWVPRNMQERDLSVLKAAEIQVRRPGPKHIQHIAVMLSNDKFMEDLGIVAIQFMYNYQGRNR